MARIVKRHGARGLRGGLGEGELTGPQLLGDDLAESLFGVRLEHVRRVSRVLWIVVDEPLDEQAPVDLAHHALEVFLVDDSNYLTKKFDERVSELEKQFASAPAPVVASPAPAPVAAPEVAVADAPVAAPEAVAEEQVATDVEAATTPRKRKAKEPPPPKPKVLGTVEIGTEKFQVVMSQTGTNITGRVVVSDAQAERIGVPDMERTFSVTSDDKRFIARALHEAIEDAIAVAQFKKVKTAAPDLPPAPPAEVEEPDADEPMIDADPEPGPEPEEEEVDEEPAPQPARERAAARVEAAKAAVAPAPAPAGVDRSRAHIGVEGMRYIMQEKEWKSPARTQLLQLWVRNLFAMREDLGIADGEAACEWIIAKQDEAPPFAEKRVVKSGVVVTIITETWKKAQEDADRASGKLPPADVFAGEDDEDFFNTP
jgi:hypothetical protein